MAARRRPLAAALLTGALLWACGDPALDIVGQGYEPRIAIEGLLMPGYPVRGIRVTRNFRVDRAVPDLRLDPGATVTLVDEGSGRRFPLEFQDALSLDGRGWGYPGTDLAVDYGGTYSLEVAARVDGQDLFARATTTVPDRGFRIVAISPERVGYRERDAGGQVRDVTVAIERSPGTRFYLLTVRPLEPSQESFIHDNPFTDETPGQVDLIDFAYEWEWVQNAPPVPGLTTMNVFWWDLWFYGRYEVVAFAADANYARFIQTFDEVQEEDGNFHEPEFAIEGDGIGYFGSAVPDTVYLEVTR